MKLLTEITGNFYTKEAGEHPAAALFGPTGLVCISSLRNAAAIPNGLPQVKADTPAQTAPTGNAERSLTQ